MSFNNIKLVHTFGSFIYFAFPASADNMSDMRSGGCGGGGRNTSFNTRICCWMGSHFHDWSDSNWGGRIFNRFIRMGSQIFGILG